MLKLYILFEIHSNCYLVALFGIGILFLIAMSDLTKDLRLAIDTGEVSFGNKTVMRAISGDKAKMVVVASKGKKEIVDDLAHVCNVAGVKLVKFKGNSLELGAACGRPYSVNSLAVINEGNSGILNEEYS